MRSLPMYGAILCKIGMTFKATVVGRLKTLMLTLWLVTKTFWDLLHNHLADPSSLNSSRQTITHFIWQSITYHLEALQHFGLCPQPYLYVFSDKTSWFKS